jgi:RHS repeat-associated protein
MRSLRILGCLFTLVFYFAPQPANAQNDPNAEVGLKAYGSYNIGNIDNINVGNGALDVDIPLISYPQRGGKLKLDFSLHYFNGSSSKSEQCYEGYCIWIPSGYGGGFAVIDTQSMNVGPPPACTLYNSGNGVTYCNYRFVDSDGASHLYAPTNSSSSASRSLDASGILDSIDSQGITHSNMSYAYPDSREDANGNEISYSISAGTWTDTMGRTIPAQIQSKNQSDFAGCTGVQPIDYVELWTLPGVANTNGGNSSSTYPLKLCYGAVPIAGGTTTPALTSVLLPNGTAWTFTWVQSATTNMVLVDVSQITFPTGGTLSYTWTQSNYCSSDAYAESETVLTRTLNPNDGVTPASQWTYAYDLGVTTLTDPAGNASTHTFGVAGPPGTANSCYLYENQAKYYQGSSTSGTLLKTVNTKYSYSIWSQDPLYLPTQEPAISVVPIEVDTVWPNGQQSTIKHTYDTGFTVYYPFYNPNQTLMSGDKTTTAIYGKELTKQEYDYGGTLLRTTTNTYLALNNSTYLNANLLDLTSSVQVQDGGGTQRAYTTYAYDETGSPAGAHGNLTSTHRWLNTTGTYLVSSNVYNSNGLVTSSTDPKGNPTTYGYAPSSCPANSGYAGSGPNSVANALSQTTSNCYDLTTGLLISTTDPNSKTTTYAYDDMLRTTSIAYPDTGSTTFAYPTSSEVDISEKIDASPRYKTASLLVDGVGREIRRIVSNGESIPYDQVDTYYDFSSGGHFNFKSYSYQGNGFSTVRVTSGAGDTTSYDALNRTTSAMHSDGSSVLTSFTGRAASVQDEGNGTQRVQRISQVDGLGRLASVCEVSGNLTVGIAGSQSAAACAQDIGGTGFLTTYAYDALDNLTSVAQGPLNARSFIYDSLSRLTSSANPEAGTTTYTYDADGNVLTKKDARSITSTYVYDALNRVTSRTYSDGTPTVAFYYDQSSVWGVSLGSSVGRLTSNNVWNGSWVSSEIFAYDPMGRVINNSQCTPQNCSGTPLSIAYTYDLLGDIKSSTDGEGVTLTNSYNAGARLTSVTSNLSDSNHPGTLFGYQNPAHYNAAGSLTSVTLGNNINETRTYDGRLRLTGITDGSVYTLAIPSSGGYAPNSDILAANDSVNLNWTYGYDALNRLVSSNQNSGTTTYSYADDRFGNRWNQTVTHGTGTPSSLGFDANNHITASYGVTYDAAGDTTSDGTTTYTYDAEGRVITAVNGQSGTSTYQYGADGRRVEKTTFAGGTVDFVYDLARHEIAQNSAGSFMRGEIYAGGRHVATYYADTTYFIHADWLGTERARSNVSGALCESITSLPYGDAMTTSGSCGDPSPMHFTGKEHDTETGLENFGARYDSSSMGRFMTPDWSAQPEDVPYADMTDPQSLNIYIYVKNNPVSRTDPDGHCCDMWDVIDFAIGAANAWSSDNVGGAGRQNQDTPAGKLGQAVGDAVATIQGSEEIAGGGAMVITSVAEDATGAGAVLGVPQAAVGSGLVADGAVAGGTGGANLIKDVVNAPMSKSGFSDQTKSNTRANAGGKCEYCGQETTPGQKSQKGVTPPGNEGQTDHYDPASKGGSNDPSNAVHACRNCNTQKSNTPPQGTQWERPKKPCNTNNGGACQ